MSKHARLSTEKDAEELSRLNQAFNGGEAVPAEKIRKDRRRCDIREEIVTSRLEPISNLLVSRFVKT